MAYYGDRPRIENHVEITHAISRMTHPLPDGTRAPMLVINPEYNHSAPRYLHVSMPRKGFPQDVMEVARENGLEVADIWQYDGDKSEDRIRFQLKPIPEERREGPAFGTATKTSP